MAATFTAYTAAGVSLGTISPSSASWQHTQGEDGSGTLTAAGDLGAGLLAENVVIRVNDGTADRFAFVPTRKTRRQVESSTELDLSGPGVKWLLHAGQVYQEDTTDCAEPAGQRWFGWMSPDFNTDDWVFASSHGTFQSGPFATSRPEDWPASLAHFITPSTSVLAARTWYASKDFTLAADTDFIAIGAADDEYRVFIDGRVVLDTTGGGPFQWQKWQQQPLRLCAGAHTIRAEVRNLTRASAATNQTWFIFALAPPGTDGKLQNANQKWNVYHDASGGTFTLSTAFGFTTSAIAYDATAATIQTALEAIAIPGAGNVTVSGSNTLLNEKYSVSHDHTGGTFTLTAYGQTTSAIAHNASAATVELRLETDIAKLNENVTVTGTGTGADPWVIEFDNNLSLQEVTLTGNGGGLTGGTTFTVSNTQSGTSDPWVVEFSGDLGSTYVPLSADGASLTGGTISVDEVQRGQGAEATIKTDTTWSILDNPASVPGLTPGHILRLALEEIQARGTTVLDNVTLGFTDTVDSDGNAWDSELVFPLSLDADMHRLSVLLDELGFPIDVTPALVLECWNTRGSDLSATVTLTQGTAGVSHVVATQDETTVKNVIRVRADDGWFDATDATSVTARGRWEEGTVLAGFANQAEAEKVTGPLLTDVATPLKSTKLDIPSEAAVLPYDDFTMGDIVTAPAFGTSGFTATDMRVVGISGQVEESSIVWTVELID